MNEKAAREREALLARLRELHDEIAQLRQEARAGEKRLPIEEQFRLNLERLIEMKMPHTAGKVRVEIVHPRANNEAVFPDPPPKPTGKAKFAKILLSFGRRSFV
jgi:hypothetical protein